VVSGRHQTSPEDVTNSLIMNSHLTVGDRWRTVSLRLDQGMTPNQIVSVINCSRATVFNILQLFREKNNVIEREGRDRTLLNNRRRTQDNITVDRMIENFMRYQNIQLPF